MSEKHETLTHIYQVFSQNCPFLQEIFPNAKPEYAIRVL